MKKEAPSHYKGNRGGDTIKFINTRDGLQKSVDFCLSNILKYATRLWRKDSPVEDARKIIIYASRAYKDVLEDAMGRGLSVNVTCDRERLLETVSYIENQLGVEAVISYLQGTIIAESKSIDLSEVDVVVVLEQLDVLCKLGEELFRLVDGVINVSRAKVEVKWEDLATKPKIKDTNYGIDDAIKELNEGAKSIAATIVNKINDQLK